MRNLLLLGCGLFIHQFCGAQIIAGSGAAGQTISDPDISLSNPTMGTTVSGTIDVDCNGIHDLRIDLYKGYVMIDGAHAVYLYVTNPNFQICADTGGYIATPHYFNSGNPLVATPAMAWKNDTIYKVSTYGCMECTGPATASNIYFAYRNTVTSQAGWIQCSFDLSATGTGTPVTAQIPQVLSPCSFSGVSSPSTNVQLTVSPNPFTHGFTLVPGTTGQGTVTVTSAEGKTVWSAALNGENSLYIPAAGWNPGVYIVTTVLNGSTAVQRVIRE